MFAPIPAPVIKQEFICIERKITSLITEKFTFFFDGGQGEPFITKFLTVLCSEKVTQIILHLLSVDRTAVCSRNSRLLRIDIVSNIFNYFISTRTETICLILYCRCEK